MFYKGPVADIHNHTEYSPMDGLTTCAEGAARAAALGHPAAAITDHGTPAGHPQWQYECDKAGVKPLFGLEAYFQPDRKERPGEGDEAARSRLWGGRHLILLAQDNRGLNDLWAASSEAWSTGRYHKPRMDWEVLEEHGSRLIATTACLGGVGSKDLWEGLSAGDNDRVERGLATIDRLKSVFGDRLYLEIQANELANQRVLNEMLVAISQQYRIPLVLGTDAHYPSEAETELHRLWMMCQTGKGKDDYWHFSPMLAEDRMREFLHYLDPRVVGQALANTMEIADRCSARIDAHFDPPVFGASAEEDARQLLAMCRANWSKVPGGREYEDRQDREFEVVASKGMAGCYLMVEEIVSWVKAQGWLVGPGRGSDAASLMSYLIGITSIDPLPTRLLFERFLTPGRVSLPDFDLDFASSKRGAIQQHVVDRYGADHVVRVGTIMRYGLKGIVNKLFSVLADRLSEQSQGDSKQISKIIDEAEAGTAGLGLPLDEIMEEGALQQYIERYAVIFQIARQLHNRVYAYGKHPAGLVISPQVPLTGLIPTRSEAGELAIGEWDYRVIDEMGLFKLDLLTVRTLDTVQECIDLIEKRTGTRLNPRSWKIEHSDPQVWDEIDTGLTLGMFQIETDLCRGYCSRMGPRTLGDLSDLTTFIRPGPRNSGATEAYLRRRAGYEEVSYPHPLLEEALATSYGVMLYQEDILNACRQVAGYDDLEADGVRKILGKKLTEKIAPAGEEFVRRCVERGHDEEQVRAMWASMAEFGKYAFNRAHAYSYATLSYWTAWLKAHYPLEMLTAILSTIGDHPHAVERMADFTTEARRIGIAVLPPDVRYSGAGFTMHGLAIRYALGAVKGVGPAAVRSITRSQPYFSYHDFQARSGANAGVQYALARAGALDPLVPSRKGLVAVIDADRDGSAVRCVHKLTGPPDPFDEPAPNGLPCTYPWAEEPQPPPRYGKGGKQLKVTVKPPPARCTVSCRRYTPPEALPMGTGEYRPDELFRSDYEVYLTWMNDAPFAQLDEMDKGLRQQAREIALMLQGAPERHEPYPLAAILAEWHQARTRAGGAMWWVTLVTEVSSLNLACFSPYRDDEPDVPLRLRSIRPGSLVSAQVTKRSYQPPGRAPRMGWLLSDIWKVS